MNWDATGAPVLMVVELPFWLMVSDCRLDVSVRGFGFQVEVTSNDFELYSREVSDSRQTCFRIGPPDPLRPEIQKLVDDPENRVVRRKCKTVIRIHSRCNEDVLAAASEEGKRSREAAFFLKAFCGAHLEVVNHVVQHYRLSTYDFFPHELSPWDVPVWFVNTWQDAIRVALVDYAQWDNKPVIRSRNERDEVYSLIDPNELQDAMSLEPSPGEMELLDAQNLMERGDYTGAVRRITTATEAILEFVLGRELLKTHPLARVEESLRRSRMKFLTRFKQYLKLSKRLMTPWLETELEATRAIRHEIVHRGLRIPFPERGRAQRAVDTGRWIFNWLEDDPARASVRERRIAMRTLGRHFSLFRAEITADGVVVHKPGAH